MFRGAEQLFIVHWFISHPPPYHQRNTNHASDPIHARFKPCQRSKVFIVEHDGGHGVRNFGISKLTSRPASRGETITAEQLRALLHYDPETGIFRWIAPFHKSRGAGAVAGSHRCEGRRAIRIGKDRHLVSRLAWLYMTGSWPVAYIDHIDGNPSNDAFSNLREATKIENCRNRMASGIKYDKRCNRYYAGIRVNGEFLHLGTFLLPEEAKSAYVEATKRYFGEFSAFTSRGIA